jgi:predicted Zn-dependent peptidase
MTVRVTTLDNGLRVATDGFDTVDSVSLGMWVGVGTRHERPETNGVSHMLEHMAFKGTERRSAQDIAREIEAVGGHLNAYTSREVTAYYARILKEDVPLAVDVIADILQKSVFDAKELERERTVILQEIGQAADQPDDLIFDLFQEAAYPGQPLGRPVLGSAEVVKSLTRGQVAGYMREWYRAPRMVLAAAGRVEHEAFVDLAEQAFRDLANGAGMAPEQSRYSGGDSRRPRELEQVHLVLGFEGVSFCDPDFYASQVLSTLLGGGMSSRLFQEVREKRGLVYSVYSFASTYLDGGLFAIYAGTGEKQVGELIPVVCDELRKVGESVEEEEVTRTRAQLKAGLLMSRESTSVRCEQLAQHLLVHGRPLPVSEVVEKIESVDDAAISRVARRLLAAPASFAAVGPVGGIEPLEGIRARLS